MAGVKGSTSVEVNSAAVSSAASAAREAALRAAQQAAIEAAKAAAVKAAAQLAMPTDGFKAAAATPARTAAAQNRVVESSRQVLATLDQLEPRAEATRTLRAEFSKDFSRVANALANGTMTPADAEARTEQWLQAAGTLIPGKDTMDVSTNNGVTFSQSARSRLEGAGDWSLTTRTEAQDLQGNMVAGLLAGKVPWEFGMEQVRAIAKTLPPEGQPLSLEGRSALLGGLRGASDDFWAVAKLGDLSVNAGTLSALSDPLKTLTSLLESIGNDFADEGLSDIVEEFAPRPAINGAHYDLASQKFLGAIQNAAIPEEYKPVSLVHNAAKDASWAFKDGDTNPLHYFACDVRNPTTGQTEQNVYHLDPGTGVLTQVSNLDANGRRLQEPKSPPWTAGPASAQTASKVGSINSQLPALEALGAKLTQNGTRRALALPTDVNMQHQSDRTIKIWRGNDKSTAITLPADTLKNTDLLGGNRWKAVPQTADNVVGQRQDATLASLKASDFGSVTTDPATGRPALGLNDSIAFWVDKEGRLNLQDRRGPEGVDRGNPDNPIFRLSASETAQLAAVNGGGWQYVLSDWNAPKSALNPKPHCGPFGEFKRGADGSPVPVSPLSER